MRGCIRTIESGAQKHVMEGDSADESAFRMVFIKGRRVHYVTIEQGEQAIYMAMKYAVVMLRLL